LLAPFPSPQELPVFKSLRPRALATIAAAAAVLVGVLSAVPTADAAYNPPPVKHVWVINLENENFAYTFGAAGHKFAPYLTKTLVSQGAFLRNYYGTGHDSLDNYVAEISGQAGNYEMNEDCGIFSPFTQFGGENFDKLTKYGQLSGGGCVFPNYIPTIASQLDSAHLSWRGYMQDMGVDPHRDGTVNTANGPACGHPKLNAVDLTDTTGPANDSYATRHDPFVYFDGVIDNTKLCDSHVLSFDPMVKNLKSVSTTPNYSFVTPNTCFDGHDWPKCQDGSPGRLPKVEDFLKSYIPKITDSPAYRQNGLVIITFDESGSDDNAGACCGELDGLGFDDPSHPNLNENGLYGPGGGRVGAVLLSKYIKPGTVSDKPYNHYSMLRSVEDLFGLKHIGDALMPQVHSFGPDVYTRPKG
jgi:phosphatidylinositol-3-phosphatase